MSTSLLIKSFLLFALFVVSKAWINYDTSVLDFMKEKLDRKLETNPLFLHYSTQDPSIKQEMLDHLPTDEELDPHFPENQLNQRPLVCSSLNGAACLEESYFSKVVKVTDQSVDPLYHRVRMDYLKFAKERYLGKFEEQITSEHEKGRDILNIDKSRQFMDELLYPD